MTLEFTNRGESNFLARIDFASFTATDDTGQRYTATRNDQVQRDVPPNATGQLTTELQPVLVPAARRLTLQAQALSGVSPFSVAIDLTAVDNVLVRASLSTTITGRPFLTLEFENRTGGNFIARLDFATLTATDDTGQQYTPTRRDVVQRDVLPNSSGQLTTELQPVLSSAATRLTLQAQALSGVSPFSLSFSLH